MHLFNTIKRKHSQTEIIILTTDYLFQLFDIDLLPNGIIMTKVISYCISGYVMHFLIKVIFYHESTCDIFVLCHERIFMNKTLSATFCLSLKCISN